MGSRKWGLVIQTKGSSFLGISLETSHILWLVASIATHNCLSMNSNKLKEKLSAKLTYPHVGTSWKPFDCSCLVCLYCSVRPYRNHFCTSLSAGSPKFLNFGVNQTLLYALKSAKTGSHIAVLIPREWVDWYGI